MYVLASMLRYSAEQRARLGLVKGPERTVREMGDLWVHFLEAESSK